MASTLAQLIEQTRRHLTVGKRDAVNKLASTINSSTETVTWTYDHPAIGSGKRFSIDLEDFLCFDAASKSTTGAVRGFNGSTAATHSANALIYVEPEFSAYEIVVALQDELAALPGEGIARFQTIDFTWNASRVGYDMTSVTEMIEGRRLSWKETGGELKYRAVHRNMWEIKQGMPTGDFASAEALFVYDRSVAPGTTMRLLYTTPWTALTATTAGLALDVETVTGLPARAHPLLAMGAALRLTDSRPIPRTSMTGQGDTRRPEEVSASDAGNASTRLERRYLLAHAAERLYLTKKYGL